MNDVSAHQIELFTPEAFKILLEHEVNKSHRYGDSLTLIDLLVEAEPADSGNQHNVEALAIRALNMHLRKTDVPCRKGNEFLILMPATAAPGARTACERFKKLLAATSEAEEAVTCSFLVFIGMATLPNEDRSVTSEHLAQNALKALQHAQTNRLKNVVSFSELNK